MFGVSYPDDDDVLGWVFVSIVSFNLLLLIFLHLAESYPSYSKLYDQGFAKSKCAPEFLKNTNINYRMGFFMCYFPAMLAAPIVAIVTIFVNNTDDVFLTSYAVCVNLAWRTFQTVQWYKNESKRKVQRNSETTSTQIDP